MWAEKVSLFTEETAVCFLFVCLFLLWKSIAALTMASGRNDSYESEARKSATRVSFSVSPTAPKDSLLQLLRPLRFRPLYCEMSLGPAGQRQTAGVRLADTCERPM